MFIKVECPNCNEIAELPYVLNDLKKYKKNKNPLTYICLECGEEYDCLNNIEYKPLTGGTGEVDPNKSILPEISLRDYFAGQAMNALIVSEKSTLDKILNMIDFHKDDFDDKVEKKRIQYMKMWIEQSFKIADAMVKESEK